MRKQVGLTSFIAALLILVSAGAVPLPASGSAGTAQENGPSQIALARGLAEAHRHRREIRNHRVWTLIDYDLAFTSIRLWVMDAERDNTILARSRVSHAWRSGVVYATRFSNENGSNLSSLGSYVTVERTYEGKFGHSLKVRGLDPGINDRALERAIIFHPDLNMTHSLGCFMLPMSESRSIIDRIVGGSFVYVHRSEG